MQTIYLLQYNNYYNRLVKIGDELSDYQDYLVNYNGSINDPYLKSAIIENVNFFENDDVDTTLVINWDGAIPDYLLVTENNLIKSRWFVIDAIKTRSGQLKLNLHRDLIADYYNSLMDDNTAIFVEKAMISGDNDLIFNNENMTFNQIKQSETLIKDSTECPWICVFAARDDAEQTLTYTVDLGTSIEVAATLTLEEFNDYLNNPSVKGDGELQYVQIKGRQYNQQIFNTFEVAAYGDFATTLTTGAVPSSGVTGMFKSAVNAAQVRNVISPIIDGIKLNLSSVISDYDTQKYSKMRSLDNQNIRVIQSDGTTKIYSVSVQFNGLMGQSDAIGKLWTDNIRPAIEELYYSNKPTNTYSHGIGYAAVVWAANIATISFTDITSSTATRTVTIGSGRTHLMDAPYDMFCMPFSDDLKVTVGTTTLTSSKELALTFASNISKNSKVYDVQLLPYCPLVGATVSNGTLTVPDASGASIIYGQEPGSTNKAIGYVLHANKSSFSRNIPLENPIKISDYKIENETDLYRLVSPNYNGSFEFSAAKNGGINSIQIQCTYKPFNSYIKLYPVWGRLYGSDFGNGNFDARGLICGGDFSLARVTSAWEEYELRNKNYQLAFDRQIQNLEVRNSVQRENEAWGIFSGTLGSAIKGSSGGIAGAIVGAGTSLFNGVRESYQNERLREETIDYTRDQFGYNLGNIKALPMSLSKVTSYNVDNKYFPFLEYYTCSAVEKNALKNKIKYNGMTIMTIGNLKSYVQNYQGDAPMYFKGKLIRLEGFNGDFHILNALAQELNKGVFIA